MSNKLFKGGDAEHKMAEQRAQYACIFGLAAKYLLQNGGEMIMSVTEINLANSQMIKFEAVDANGHSIDKDSQVQPAGVKCWIDEETLAMVKKQTTEPPGMDA